MLINSKGQSLLEITIALGIAGLIVSALTITTLLSLKQSQFAKDQIQANKLAQEGLEKIKSMKEENLPICITGVKKYWRIESTNNDLIWDETLPANNNKRFFFEASGYTCQIGDIVNSSETSIDNKFSRYFLIENLSDTSDTKQKKISSVVTWVDGSGEHSSNQVTILADY